MNKKVVATLRMTGLIALLVACQSLNQASSSSLNLAKNAQVTASSRLKNEAKSEEIQASDQENPDSDKVKAVETITTSLKEAVARDPKSRQFIQKILTQPQKIDHVVEACSAKNSYGKRYPTDVRFAGLFKLSDEKAALYISCYLGFYQGAGVLFWVSKSDGIQTQPLALTRLTGYNSGKFKEIEASAKDSKAITGYFGFSESTKKLSLLYRCDGLWSCFSSARYTLEDDRFILQEYVVGERNLDGKDIRYTTQQFKRSKSGWLSSGLMKCNRIELESCTKGGKQ